MMVEIEKTTEGIFLFGHIEKATLIKFELVS